MDQAHSKETDLDGAAGFQPDDSRMWTNSKRHGVVLSQFVNTKETFETKTDKLFQLEDYYDLNSGEKLAVIFNHETFDKFNDSWRKYIRGNKDFRRMNKETAEELIEKLMMKKRSGTDNDVHRIKEVFEGGLGFKVKVWQNLTKSEIRGKMDWIQMQSGLSCLALFILTHGGKNGRLTASDDFFSLNEDVMAELLPAKSPNLKGKPKMIFVQACQGGKFDKGAQLDTISRHAYHKVENSSYGCPQV